MRGVGPFNHNQLIWSEWYQYLVKVIDRFKWILWRVTVNITIINGMMLKYPHGIQNHSSGLGGRDTVSKVKLCRLAIPIYLWLGFFINMKCVELVSNILRLVGSKLGPRMIQASALCPILPQYLQITLCSTQRAARNGWIVSVSLSVED